MSFSLQCRDFTGSSMYRKRNWTGLSPGSFRLNWLQATEERPWLHRKASVSRSRMLWKWLIQAPIWGVVWKAEPPPQKKSSSADRQCETITQLFSFLEDAWDYSKQEESQGYRQNTQTAQDWGLAWHTWESKQQGSQMASQQAISPQYLCRPYWEYVLGC